MFVETIAGSLEVIIGYFVIVPLIVKLVSSVIGVVYSFAQSKISLLIARYPDYNLAMMHSQLKIKTYFAENS